MQTASSIREKLHQYIDMADEKKLQAIYVLLEGDAQQDQTFSPDEIALFYERRKRYQQGMGQSFSIEESVSAIRGNNKA